MALTHRLQTLCSLLKSAKSFADVGCDHGYCSEYVLKNGLCKDVVFSDVSKGSLAKAEKLLAAYMECGQARAVLGDGFFGVSKDTEEVLIAGMGGSEIISILSHETYGFMPKYFVFQPMHDSEKLRRYILENDGYIERDFTFFDGKFYDVIVGGKAAGRTQKAYTDAEYEFGRENLETMSKDFTDKIKKLLKNTDKSLQIEGLGENSREELEARKQRLDGVLKGEIK